jgi:hypothetical protein
VRRCGEATVDGAEEAGHWRKRRGGLEKVERGAGGRGAGGERGRHAFRKAGPKHNHVTFPLRRGHCTSQSPGPQMLATCFKP